MALKSEHGSREHGRAALRAALSVHRRAPLSHVLARRGLGPYRGYAELLEAIDRLADRGAQISLIGRSVRGEPLLALHLGGGAAATVRGAAGGEGAAPVPPGGLGKNGVACPGAATRFGGATGDMPPSPDAARVAAELERALGRGGLGRLGLLDRTRTTVVLSGIHPLEWIGIETHLALLERLASEDLSGRSIFAVPIVNPDGLLRVEMNLRAGRRRYVRSNARGVDLNRNFDAGWYERGVLQRLIGLVFSPGSRPASEPEVEAIAHALSPRRIDRALSLHSFGGAVLYPPGNALWPVPDAAEHRTCAQRIARAADRRPYRVRSCVRASCGFRRGGMELDWFHDRHGALSLLVECSRGGFGLRPSRLLEPFAWYNPQEPGEIAGRLADALAPFARGA